MARDYAKFYPRFFTGETGKSFRGDLEAIAVATYLIAGPPSNMIGLYDLAIPLLAHHLGIPFEGASKALRRLSEGGFCRYDEATETVWLIEGARHQVGETLKAGDNQVPFVRKLLEGMCKSPFYNDFLDRYAQAYHLQDMPRSEAPSKGLRRVSEATSKPVEDKGAVEVAVEVEGTGAVEVEKNVARPKRERSVVAIYTPGFQKFWDAYPDRRKTGKAKAAESWNRQKLEPLTDQIVASVEDHKTWHDWTKQNGDFIPGPVPFLNQRRWEDVGPSKQPDPPLGEGPLARQIREAFGGAVR